MNTVIVENCKTLFIGRRGENEVTEVVFDFSEWQTEFGNGVIDLFVKRNGDSAAYPVVLSVDGTVATWIVTDADTAVVGSGKIEFVYTVNEKVAKSAIFPFYVGEDIGQASSEPPDPYESWIETLTELGTETQANAQAAAQSASDAADSAASASESAGQAEDSAEDAEAWAVGERNGEPVSEGDPTYENSAKYWAWKAKTDAPVTSVNGEAGDIVLDLDDIPNGETFARATPEQLAQIGKNAADIADIDEMIPNTTSESNPLVNVSFLTNRLTSYRTSAAQDAIDSGKQEEITAFGILKRDRSGNITGAIAGTDYLTADALNGYRKASAQDAIDNAQNTEIGKNTAAINTMQPAATAADIGKALIVKTVTDGKPTSYEYGEAGGGGGSALTAGDGIDITEDVISNTQGIEYIVGTQAASTASWKGNSTDETLKVGKIIAYYLPFAGRSSSNATLTLTMGNGAQTAAIPLRRTGTSAVTNQFAAGNVIILIYDGTYWRVSAYYDQNDNTVPTGYCLSPAATAAKAATCSYGYRGDTNYFPCLFRYANTATDATLAITTYAPEAAPIYVNGARTSAENTFSAGVILFLYYNGAYYCYNDGRFPILVDGAVTSVQEYATGLLVNYRTAAAQDTIDTGKQAKITATGILKGDGDGGVSAAVAGVDYLKSAPVTSVNGQTGDVTIQTATDAQVTTAVNTWLGENVAQETGYVLDASLTMSNAAPPASAVGDLKSAVENGTKNAYDGYNIYPNTVLSGGGYVLSNPDWWSTGLIPVDETAIAYYTNTTKFMVTEHSENTIGSFIKRTVVRDESLYYFSADAKYFRLSFLNVNPVGEATFVPVYNAQTYGITSAINRLANPPLSWGRENVLSRARHFLDIEWTPVAPFPLCTGSYKYRIVPAGEKQVGLPYSSTRNVAKLIGVNISIYTFMTALANPRSVLYTRKITTGYVGASYYGQHCASFVAYANGDKGCAIDSLGMADIYSKEISKYELQPGDMLISAQDRTRNFGFLQHCLLVYGINRDKYGRIDTLQIVEGNFPYARYNPWTYFSDVEREIDQGYKCYRGNTVDATPYELCDFVKGYPDETLPQFVYPDIMPEYGDKACVEAGTDVVINVINPKTYTQIEVYKDDTRIDTRSAISDFTMADIAYGKYRFVITDGNNTSESSLIAAAVSGTYDSNTGVVTFSCSNNAKPVAMQSYADESSKAGYGGVHNLEHLFTSEEIINGQANASTITSSAFPNVQVSFLSEYGTAVWSSNPLADQWEYWNPNDLQILTQPLDANVKAGNQFTMSVLVNKDNVNYQWQYYYQNQWRDFQGGNAASLTKTPPSTSWNGWKIRCIVADANDPTVTVTSREATLRVSASS